MTKKNKITTPNKSWKSIRKVLKELKVIKDPKIFLRGKYEMWFLIEFLNNLIKELNKGIPKGQERYKLNPSMAVSNSVTLLGPRLRIPKDIKDFLDNNLSKL